MVERGEKDILKQIQRPREGQQADTLGREETARRRQDVPQERPSGGAMAQMDRLFDEVFKRPFFSLWSHRMGEGEGEAMEQQLYLPVDIYEDGDSVVVKAEIPGIRREDINVELSPESITISGQKSEEHRVQKTDFYRLERSYGSFSRTCHLPAECLTDRARAVFKDGVLEVRIPKSAAVTPRGRKLTVE